MFGMGAQSVASMKSGYWKVEVLEVPSKPLNFRSCQSRAFAAVPDLNIAAPKPVDRMTVECGVVLMLR